MLVTIQNKRNQTVGFIDSENRYRTKRDNYRGQIFRHPKYGSGIAIDVEILKKLKRMKVNTIIVQILNFEKRTFYIETDINHFLANSEKFCCDKKSEHLKVSTYYSGQRRMPMNKWTRHYPDQKKLCS